MKTRNFFLVAAMTLFMAGSQAMAQTTTTGNKKVDPAELLNRRCNRMCTEMKLDDATSAKFTPLYKEYLNELKACRPTRPAECKNGTCTDAQRKACIENRLDCRENMVKVQKKYYKQFEKILNAQQLQTVFCKNYQYGRKGNLHGRRHANCSYRGSHTHANCRY